MQACTLSGNAVSSMNESDSSSQGVWIGIIAGMLVLCAGLICLRLASKKRKLASRLGDLVPPTPDHLVDLDEDQDRVNEREDQDLALLAPVLKPRPHAAESSDASFMGTVDDDESAISLNNITLERRRSIGSNGSEANDAHMQRSGGGARGTASQRVGSASVALSRGDVKPSILAPSSQSLASALGEARQSSPRRSSLGPPGPELGIDDVPSSIGSSLITGSPRRAGEFLGRGRGRIGAGGRRARGGRGGGRGCGGGRSGDSSDDDDQFNMESVLGLDDVPSNLESTVITAGPGGSRRDRRQEHNADSVLGIDDVPSNIESTVITTGGGPSRRGRGPASTFSAGSSVACPGARGRSSSVSRSSSAPRTPRGVLDMADVPSDLDSSVALGMDMSMARGRAHGGSGMTSSQMRSSTNRGSNQLDPSDVPDFLSDGSDDGPTKPGGRLGFSGASSSLGVPDDGGESSRGFPARLPPGKGGRGRSTGGSSTGAARFTGRGGDGGSSFGEGTPSRRPRGGRGTRGRGRGD
eukprot:NODE_890_length_2713_cov_6.040217.p2 GENE.NODE_890_length_2713_cov_6.040217~~NODE_890_length_2713_cov_6.040217.p2  ORF type:complete len:525 (-),score=111.88 NODE_890_length_2713_cov_6.040217:60-1634(-)